MIQGILGLAVFIGISWLFSENRKSISIRMVASGLGLQVVFGILLLKLSFFRDIFIWLNNVVLALEESTQAGTSFVFGYLGGGALPFDEPFPGAGYILAFRGLPLVLVMSALSSLLFYWKILPLVVKGFSKVMQKSMRIGGAEGLGVSANVFVGMVESPLLIRPYLNNMTRSEIFSLITCGMATIAGTVMVLYANVLKDVIPNVLAHILTASIISAPAAVMIAKIMVPETNRLTSGEMKLPEEASSSMDAVTKGTVQGLQLLLNIIAMVVVLVALVHLVNILLGIIPDIGGKPLTLQRLLGFIMAPIVWLTGISWSEAFTAGSLMGTKTILNEFIAYLEMGKLASGTLSEKSKIILMYAMCGFANPGSLGIMIGGLGAMAPERRNEIVALGFRSIIAGTLATLMTGTVVGILI